GIGAGIENTPDGMQSQVLLAADRIAMVNPANGNTTPLFVAQGDQLFLNEVFMSRATIDFAEITGVLRSSGFEVRGQGGWDLSRELNCFRVDDENNVIRVRMGRLF
ncbi:phage tail tip fiber protein, partial [Escherichia coli]